MNLEVFTFLMYCRIAYDFESQGNRRKYLSRIFSEESEKYEIQIESLKKIAISITRGSIKYPSTIELATAFYFLSTLAENEKELVRYEKFFYSVLTRNKITLESYVSEIKRRLENHHQKIRVKRKTKVTYKKIRHKKGNLSQKSWVDDFLDLIEGESGCVKW